MSIPSGSSQQEAPSRFFGVDVSALWRDCRAAWRDMGRWPVVSWLWPSSDIGVLMPDLQLLLSRRLQDAPIRDERRARNARYGAVVLPEDLLLRRTFALPGLQAADLDAALALEVQSLNPFAADDLQWAVEIEAAKGQGHVAHLVLASRKLIAQYLERVQAQAGVVRPEVWVPSAGGTGYVLLKGYGEGPRLRQGAAWGWVVAGMLLLLILLALALAVTPSAQLYLRGRDAQRTMADLQKKAEPVLAQRAGLVSMDAQLQQARDLVGPSLAPVRLLQIVTDVLPDDSYLTSLQIQGLKVNISGQTVNAAALMKHLGNIPGLRNVRAPTPATKPLGVPNEIFNIEFLIEPDRLGPSVAPASPAGSASAPSVPAVPASAPATAASAPALPASGAAR